MVFDDLAPEIKKKLETCKSPEDVLELAKNEGYELKDEELAAVSGGWGYEGCDDYCYRLWTA